MAGFRKAAPQQAAIKMSLYGPAGSGKTFTTLLFAEGIARKTGRRVAFVDTERGSDFYAMAVPDRNPHPEAFDFDALYTRSLTEVLKDCKRLSPAEHSVIVIDSVSHLWDAAMAAYTGQKTPAGTIPMHAWGKIKQPYKELMRFLIDSPFHVFILGRQANVFEEDPDTGETKAAGFKMRAEGETQYEPHVCLRMVPQRTHKEGRKTVVHREQVIAALAEKDRSGILGGRLIEWPTFDSVIAPLLGIMGGEQGATPSEEEAASQDAESLAQADREKAAASHELAQEFKARFQLAKSKDELAKVGKELTPAVKKRFTTAHLAEVRAAYESRLNSLSGKSAPEPAKAEPEGEDEPEPPPATKNGHANGSGGKKEPPTPPPETPEDLLRRINALGKTMAEKKLTAEDGDAQCSVLSAMEARGYAPKSSEWDASACRLAYDLARRFQALQMADTVDVGPKRVEQAHLVWLDEELNRTGARLSAIGEALQWAPGVKPGEMNRSEWREAMLLLIAEASRGKAGAA